MTGVLFLAAVTLSAAAQEIPRINPDGVIANGPGPRAPLTPGMEISIYGQHLGPEAGCTARARELHELCGTVVTVGGISADLLYVQEKQINVRAPFNMPIEGMVPFIVTREGLASAAVAAQFGPYNAAIAVSGVVYADMPVWVDIGLPEPLRHSLRYPVTILPADFGGHQFEVRRDGVLLAPSSVPHPLPFNGTGLGTVGSVGSGALLGLPHEPNNPRRLPLHLLHRFHQPGRYEVRYLGYDFRYPREKNVLVRSPWISIQVAPLPAGMRQTWLESMRRAQPVDPVEWLCDYLPSLLAVPDAAVLPLLKEAMYHPDNLVRQYSLYALCSFDDTLLADWIPATIRASGPTPDLAYLLSWRRDLFQPRGYDIARSVLRYLTSTSSLLASGALQTLYFMKPQYDWRAHPEIPAQLDRAVAAQAERLIATHSAALLRPLALYLGTWKAEPSRTLLRKLIAEGTVRGQAEICLGWIGDGDPH